MTRSLPREILLTIFQDMDNKDLLNCRDVCRFWCTTAHIQLLHEVKLSSREAIEQFIVFFDRNSSQSNFEAVKTIKLCSKVFLINYMDEMVLEKETIEKLFFCFPNLENVYIDFPNMIKDFDEDLCKSIFIHCPKLDTFHIDAEMVYIRDSLPKVRPILTNLVISSQTYLKDLGNPVHFVSQFPRLKSISGDNEAINSFFKVLAMLERLPHIDELRLLSLESDNEDFFFKEKYLLIKSKATQNLLMKRLSNITDLFIQPFDNIGNALEFVAEYFTGLKRFGLECNLSEWEPDAKQDLFFRNAYNLIPLVKGDYSADFNDVSFASLSNSFTCLVENMFDKVSPLLKQRNSRILNLRIVSSKSMSEICVDLVLEAKQSPFTRNIRITTDERIGFNRLIELLKSSTATLDQVDECYLQFSYDDSRCLPINTKKYLNILGAMSSLKKVKLEVPANFMETKNQDNRPYIGPVLTQVEKATFIGTPDGTMQSLLNSCCYAFPNLKSLNIYNYSGIWRAHIGEFLLDLQDYAIEKLVFDTEPVLSKMNKSNILYFLVEVEIRSNGKRRLYKVSLDHSSCDKIDFCDLENITCNIDYLRVRLTVHHLQQVELCVRGYKMHKVALLC